MFDLDFPEYIKYFQNLKESYNDKINIHIGVEQGLMRSVADRVNSYDSAKQLDFIIGYHIFYMEKIHTTLSFGRNVLQRILF